MLGLYGICDFIVVERSEGVCFKSAPLPTVKAGPQDQA